MAAAACGPPLHEPARRAGISRAESSSILAPKCDNTSLEDALHHLPPDRAINDRHAGPTAEQPCRRPQQAASFPCALAIFFRDLRATTCQIPRQRKAEIFYMTSSFSNLSLAEPLARAVAEMGYETMTPIQEQAIPVVLQGKDVMGAAQTGTGKTAAFALPLLQRMMKHENASTSPARHPGARAGAAAHT